MNFRITLSVATLSLLSSIVTAQDIIDLELVTGGNTSLTEQQDWYEAMKSVKGVRFRMRRGSRRDEPKVENVGTETRPHYRVTGVLDVRNRMIVPGGAFSNRDMKKFASWVEKLIDEGVDGVTLARGAFGLTSKNLEAAHTVCKAIVSFETKGLTTHQAITQMQRLLGDVPLEVDPLAKRKLYTDQEVLDELKGVSVGTALTAALRPLGLALTLRQQKGKIRFVVVDPVKHQGEVWPIGWAHKGATKQAAPTLFNYLTVEIAEGTPMSKIIDSIAPRLKIPVLFDHNSMVRDGLRLGELTAKYPLKRTYYKRILEATLAQGGLKPYLRMDAANKPFLWITTTKPKDRPPE
ncbi:MAG TPA: hypothetical protein EYG57_07200 [Planctomycetes bacterium]|nr:hypothetical protein [Planctomycetota bacterium]